MAHLQGGRPAVVFYPRGHPTPYAYGHNRSKFRNNETKSPRFCSSCGRHSLTLTVKQARDGHLQAVSANSAVAMNLISFIQFHLKIDQIRPTVRAGMGVWQGVAMDSLEFHSCPPCTNPFTPCGQATPETAMRGAHKASSLRPSSALLNTPRCTLKRIGDEPGDFHDQGDNAKKEYY
jgi:hypothetical protein